MTIDPDQAGCCNRAGSIYIHTWHLDEVFVKINCRLCYLWRAVDHEGEVLEAVVTTKRDKAAALKLLKRIMKKYGSPCSVITDGCGAYSRR